VPTARRLPAPALATVFLSFAACAITACSGGSSARLEIEIAPSPEPDGTDDGACDAITASLPPAIDCVTVTVCRRTATGCEPVRVLRPEDEHGSATATEIRFSSDTEPTIRFDVALAANELHTLELRAYAAGEPYARGVVERVTTGTATLRVRLEPYARWACAGPVDAAVAPAARALHAAVALPNGEVMLLGGVSGESVAATSVTEGAPLERTIEIYDSAAARFVAVAATDTDGQPGFGAVFHRAFFVDEADGGRFVVRVVGGFSTRDAAPGARFDSIQGLTQFSSPLLPGARADVRDSVDIVYDPATRTAEIRSIEPGRFPRAGFDAVSEPDATGIGIVALGLRTSGGMDARPVPLLAGTWYTLSASGMAGATSMMLATPRFGASASSLGGGAALIWGGNVSEPDAASVSAHAGEILGGPVSGRSILGGAEGMPSPTAFHTATPIRGGILLAGGLEIAPIAGLSGGISTTTAITPLSVVRADATRGVVGEAIAFEASLWPTPILHAATAMPDGSVILIGGALRMPGVPSESQLWASRAAIRVREDDGVYTVQALPPLIVPRWGAAAAPLPGDRVLVTGGFVREGSTLRAHSSGEVLRLDPPPSRISSCGTVAEVDAGAGDAGRRDGSMPSIDDGGPIEPDAGPVEPDAGTPELDSGIAPLEDAGI
jgi:hypothetical protein